ncbi:MAG: hypothetical protein CW338_07085 [Clostridiales bacterium]|nr:hypothetical protein [Clostridiales bacterium]
MKLRTVLLSVLCVLLILCIPCAVSFGGARTDIAAEPAGDDGDDFGSLFDEEDEETDFGDWFSGIIDLFVSSASAEEAAAPEEDPYFIPVDINVGGKEPNPLCYLYDEDMNIIGYEDASIKVEVQTIYSDGVSWRVAEVWIQSPTQIRTGIAGSKVSGTKSAVPTSIAKKYNAVIAMNGDDYQQQTDAKSFEYRMGIKARSKKNDHRDILIIDENGDLNIFVRSDAAKMKAFSQAGHKPVNAFTFGPALVIDGELQEIPTDYKYNPNRNEPRSAIGQKGPLHYILVVAEGREESNSRGVTVAELADFMFYQMGCEQAYNLDGGNTAEMVINNKMYMDKKNHAERSMYDIIYFATAVDPAEWKD